MVKRYLIALLLFASPAYGQEKNHDPTGKVYSSLADYTVNRDEVARRYAYMAVGEVQKIHRSNKNLAPELTNGYWFRSGNSARNFNYWSFITYSDIGRQNCREWLENAGTTLSRQSRVPKHGSERLYTKRKPDEENWQYQQRSGFGMQFLDPFEDIFSPDELNAPFKKSGKAETYFIKLGELKSSVEIGGKLITKWEIKQYKAVVKMTQDKTMGLMPTEFEYECEDQRISHLCRVRWAKQEGLWVPTHIRSSSHGQFFDHARFFKFKWLIGKEAPMTMFDPKSDDLRLQMAEPFEFKMDNVDQFGATILGTPYDPPDDLFDDEEKKK